ncbi:MAG: type II toxin-antitoxin system Phd/YefM family antitoxin [Tissierellia bacterium]|nr:type II toxin-antitoxin system Phd/YefM family antitoxin [Tissierellia bacterium]
MDFIKEITNRTVPISEFNRGLAGRIFEDVKKTGSKVVLKNNAPECVLLSIKEYTELVEKLEDAMDILMSDERLSNVKSEDLMLQSAFEEKYNLTFDDIEPISEDELE